MNPRSVVYAIEPHKPIDFRYPPHPPAFSSLSPPSCVFIEEQAVGPCEYSGWDHQRKLRNIIASREIQATTGHFQDPFWDSAFHIEGLPAATAILEDVRMSHNPVFSPRFHASLLMTLGLLRVSETCMHFCIFLLRYTQQKMFCAFVCFCISVYYIIYVYICTLTPLGTGKVG